MLCIIEIYMSMLNEMFESESEMKGQIDRNLTIGLSNRLYIILSELVKHRTIIARSTTNCIGFATHFYMFWSEN